MGSKSGSHGVVVDWTLDVGCNCCIEERCTRGLKEWQVIPEYPEERGRSDSGRDCELVRSLCSNTRDLDDQGTK